MRFTALPLDTSKRNKIEHRLFSFLSMNWRAKPLVSYRLIVDLISITTTTTTTDTGLNLRCELDTNAYPNGITISEQEMAAINISRADFHSEWNYRTQLTHTIDRAIGS